jgi:3',5'-nucleoside bisphosphate phosphatase
VFVLDHHVHTCLSPCASLDMHPSSLVQAAVEFGLNGVIVCDHNATENLEATVRAGRARGLSVFPGIEITTEEEVHILGFLPGLAAASRLQDQVYQALPGVNNPDLFGLQVIANEKAEVVAFNQHLLAGATNLTVDDAVDAIHNQGGLAVAAHVDRESFGMVGQLGLIPPGLPLDALEASQTIALEEARRLYSPDNRWPVMCASDAHYPEQIGSSVSYLLLQELTMQELAKALRQEDRRAVLGGGKPMEDLSLHILDIAQNALEAGASRIEIQLVEDQAGNRLSLDISDNGKGMDPETVKRVLDPFFTTRTTRKVGLGLPLLAQAARAAGGDLEVKSDRGQGTRVHAWFAADHVDRAPLGDLQTTLLVLLSAGEGVDILFRRACGACEFSFSSQDLYRALEGTPLSSAEGLAMFRSIFQAGEAMLKANPA